MYCFLLSNSCSSEFLATSPKNPGIVFVRVSGNYSFPPKTALETKNAMAESLKADLAKSTDILKVDLSRQGGQARPRGSSAEVMVQVPQREYDGYLVVYA